MSICIDWSMSKSTGQTGFSDCGSPPSFFIVSRMAAKSIKGGIALFWIKIFK